LAKNPGKRLGTAVLTIFIPRLRHPQFWSRFLLDPSVFSLRSLSASALPELPMLSTSNVSAEQAETYYTQDDYYSRDAQQKASRWAGKAAAKLGLAGTVESETFQQLLNGVAPDGQSLSGKQTPAENRRAATDYTFSAPKSVSIAALVQQDILAASKNWTFRSPIASAI
jgi:hypothetical protein